jgi:hypothetical protein
LDGVTIVRRSPSEFVFLRPQGGRRTGAPSRGLMCYEHMLITCPCQAHPFNSRL